MTSSSQDARSVVSGIVRPTEPGPEIRRLDVLIGRWIIEGHLVDEAGESGGRIVASDVYEWAPGGFFVIHPAYGLIGEVGGGGLEVIGYNPTTQSYWSQFLRQPGEGEYQRTQARGRALDLAARRHSLRRRIQRGRKDPDRPPRAPQRGRKLGALDGSRADKGQVGQESNATRDSC